MIIGGDFNLILIVKLKPPKYTTASRQAAKLIRFCEDFGLLDAWRIINPKVRDLFICTHIGCPLEYNRIEQNRIMCLCRQIMDRIKDCAIVLCTLSDHNSVFVVISPPHLNPASHH